MPKGNVSVVFMGSPEFAVPTLEVLAACPDFDLVCVATQPDRSKGRGKKVSPTAVRTTAIKLGLPTMVMTKENYRQAVRKIAALKPDLIVVVAFGLILKEDLLELPRLGCVNLHGSLLPKYRGVSPIQAALLAGDEATGCTTILMDQGIDTGDILLSETVDILPDDDAQSLSNRLSRKGADLVIRTLEGLRDGSITPRKQNIEAGSYTKKILKEHGQVDWSQPADWIARFVRAMSPWPSAYTFYTGKRLILLEVRADPHIAAAEQPGTVLSLSPFQVACGKGAVEIRQLKTEGKRALDAGAFVAGSSMRVGEMLGK